jgi:hypothetical protein
MMSKPVILAAVALAVAGCGGTASTSTRPAAVVHPTPAASSYSDVESLIAAMAVHGAICAGVTFPAGDSVPGSIPPLAECSGASQGDTSISVFDTHADALAYARNMLAVGGQLGPTAEVVGPDWAVNTSPAFAAKVVRAVGGQVLTS